MLMKISILEVVNGQYFCKIINKHIYTTNLFNNEFAINNYFFDIMMININMFCLGLSFSVFGENNSKFVIFMKYISIAGVCNS